MIIILGPFSIVSNASIINHATKQDVVYKNTNKQIYLGYVKITGNGTNSTLEAVAENDLIIGLENKTSYVDFYINYTMNCSGDTDNGQIWLTVAINGQNITPALATTFNIAKGILKIPDIQVNRKDGFQFIIKVIYVSVLPVYTNQTQVIGGGVFSKSTKSIEEQQNLILKSKEYVDLNYENTKLCGFMTFGPRDSTISEITYQNGTFQNKSLFWHNLKFTIELRLIFFMFPLKRPIGFEGDKIDFTVEYKQDIPEDSKRSYLTFIVEMVNGNFTNNTLQISNEKHIVKVEGFRGGLILLKRSILTPPSFLISGICDHYTLIQ
jgi:hypothetical protein